MRKFFVIAFFIIAVFAALYFCGVTDLLFKQGPNKKSARGIPGSEVNQTKEIPKIDTPLALVSQSALLIDMRSGRTLYEKNADEKRYPASTTKIMTALLVLENMDLQKKITVGKEAGLVRPGSSVAGLVNGEEISIEGLLYGLLLPSGNDAAYVLAVNTARVVSKNADMPMKDALACFVEMMNDKAKKLGARHTHFESPDGVHSESHYTTARDLAVIANKAMQNSTFRKIVGTAKYQIKEGRPDNASGFDYRNWENTNQLIQSSSNHYFSYASGIKTGCTAYSGYCLVASAEKNDAKIISVLLESTEDGVYDDALALFNAAFKGIKDEN